MAMIGMDLSFLATGSFGLSVPNARIQRLSAAFTTPQVSAPWQSGAVASESSRVSEARALRKFIDLDNDVVTRAGDDPDLRSTFALFRALDNLQVLAKQAANKSTPASEVSRLDAQFQKGLREVQTFAAQAGGDKLTYVFGGKRARLEAPVVIPKAQTRFEGTPVQKGQRADALSGITGTEKIAITLSKSGRSDTVTVDLATISGPITIDKVADAMNAAIGSLVLTDANGDPILDADGNPTKRYLSSVEVTQNSASKGWGLRLRTTLLESMRLEDPDAAPTLVMAGASAPLTGRATGGAALTRIDDLTGAMSRSSLARVDGLDVDASRAAKAAFDAKEAAREAEAKAARRPFTKQEAPPVMAPTTVRGLAVDSQGFSYVVGTSSGDIGNQRGTGRDDLFLTKVDSEGRTLWSRNLGASGAAEGFGVTIDSNDNAIVVGQTNGRLGASDAFNGQDTLVMKFASNGTEMFAAQLDSFATDGARAVTTDAAGNIFIAGTVSGSLPGQTGQGSQDAFVARLDGSTGQLSQRIQWGSAGSDGPAAIAIADDGALLVAGNESGRAVVRRFDAANLNTQLSMIDLGDTAGGAITSLAVDADSGAIFVGGGTAADLSAGAVTGSRQGAQDGFVVRLDNSLTAQGITYLSTSGTDRVQSLAIAGGRLYAAGLTNGDLGGARTGVTDNFVSRMDLASGAVEATSQFGRASERAEPIALGVSSKGSGVLSKLGLRRGEVNPSEATGLVQQTSLRAGDHFFIRVDGGATRKITIDENETYRSLTRKLNRIAPRAVDARMTENTAGFRFSLEAREGANIELMPGKGDGDALAKLGLEPARLVDQKRLFSIDDDKDASSLKPGGVFALSLDSGFSLRDRTTAEYVASQMANAVSTVQRAYRSLFWDPVKAELAEQQGRTGSVPSYLNSQIANYQEALNRLGGGGGGGFFL
jgi:trimeric autotransporter adhesin